MKKEEIYKFIIGQIREEKVIFSLGLLSSILVVSYLTGFNLLNPLSYSSAHQGITSWRPYELNQNHLNIFRD